ncbi:MAG TPA: hypothetical protein VGQ86_05725 [Candidatus Limnocylindria bacterium]|nr:hypothetical protein [Candidatus Limnocylindria bacterium]
MPTRYAAIIAALLVIAAIGGGLAFGTIARPRPTPRPTSPPPTVALPTRTPVPTTDPNVFRQALWGACATERSIWVVSDGGGLIRYDGQDWSLVDGTLRTLTAASCDESTLYAVGPVGAVLIVDDRARSINSVDVTLQDLLGVVAMPDGAIVVGTQGTVLRLSGGTWQPYARGIDEDLTALAVFGPLSAWAVGSGGISYRLDERGWLAVPTGATATLRAVAATTPRSVVAVGDAGKVVRYDGQWSDVPSGVDVALRDVIVEPALWIVGDGGTVLAGDGGGALQRVDIGTTCDLHTVFARGADLWIVGSTGSKGGVWRLRSGSVAEKWGDC